MWTQTLPSGKVRYFERYDGKVYTITLPDAKKSTQKEAVVRLRLKANVVKPDTVTFGTMLDRYKAHLAKEMKPQTAYAADMQFRKIEKQIGRETRLAALTAPYVRKQLYFDGSASKYNERLKHFKAAIRWAYLEEMIEDIHFLDRLPKMRSERRREALAGKYLEADELNALLDGMKEEKWRLLTEFLVLSGLRIGEAIALLQSDVDLKARTITINKTYSLVMGAVSENAKTDAGNRIVSIQNELRGCIARINKTMPRRRTLFFDDGGFVQYTTYSKYFRENTERIIGRRLTVHSLRHTHVALLAAAGISLDAISRRLGHSDSAVTRDVYFHVTKKLQERDADEIKAVSILKSSRKVAKSSKK